MENARDKRLAGLAIHRANRLGNISKGVHSRGWWDPTSFLYKHLVVAIRPGEESAHWCSWGEALVVRIACRRDEAREATKREMAALLAEETSENSPTRRLSKWLIR